MIYRYEPGTWGAFLFDCEPWLNGSTADDLDPGQRAAIEATLRAKAGGRLPHEPGPIVPPVPPDAVDVQIDGATVLGPVSLDDALAWSMHRAVDSAQDWPPPAPPRIVPHVEPRDPDERDGFAHNVIAHPLLVLAPRVGRWLHHLTPPVVPSLRSRLAARRR